MEVLKRALLASLLLLPGCGFLRDPLALEVTGEEVMVHGVLSAGSDTVRVLVTRVRPRHGDGSVAATPVSGAAVQVSGAGQAVTLAEAPAGFSGCTARESQGPLPIEAGCYAAALPGGVRAGATYELSIDGSGGLKVRGSTTVPAAPAIQGPDANARFTIKRQYTGGDAGLIPVRWQAGAPGVRFGLDLRVDTAVAGARRLPGWSCSRHYAPRGEPDNAAIVLLVPIFCHDGAAAVTYDSLRATVLVTAYDPAYARYRPRATATAVPRDRFSAGLTGALGVFGAVATAGRPVTLVPVD